MNNTIRLDNYYSQDDALNDVGYDCTRWSGKEFE